MKTQHNPDEQMQAGSECLEARAAFSPYLDGALTGLEMGWVAAHLEACEPCAQEFESWRDMQTALSDLGPAKAPPDLQRQLRSAIGLERDRGSYLSVTGRFALVWRRSIAPLALQGAGGLAAALLLAAGVFRLFGPGVAVQANDDGLAHLIAPHYLYSQVSLVPVETGRDVPVVVDATVDIRGRVCDYKILNGPKKGPVLLQVEQNLLASVFKPATVFGVPVVGHVMVTYTGVSVRG